MARCHARASGPGEDLAELGRPNVLGPGICSEQGCPRLGPPFPVGGRVSGGLHAAEEPDDIGNPLNKH